MKQYQKKWLTRLKEAWTAPNKNFIIWEVTNEIMNDDTGHTDALTQELAKWLDESRN